MASEQARRQLRLAVAFTSEDGQHQLAVYELGEGTARPVAAAVLESAPQCLIADAERGMLLGRANRRYDGHGLDCFRLPGAALPGAMGAAAPADQAPGSGDSAGDGLLLEQVSSRQTFPIPVHLVADGPRVAVSHFWQGQVAIHDWLPDGSLAPLVVIEGFGSSVHERQQSSHAHSALLDRDMVYVADFGADAVRRYRLAGHSANTSVTATLEATWSAPPGAGPRHMARLADGTIVLVTELANTVQLLDPVTLAALGPAQASLPPDFTDHNQASDIHFLVDHGLLLVGHRGMNSLALHRIEGTTAPVTDWFALRGAPRVIAVGPDGLVAIACEDNGWVQILDCSGVTPVEVQAFCCGINAASVCFL